MRKRIPVRAAAAELADLVRFASHEVATMRALSEATTMALRVSVARCEHALLLSGDYSQDPRSTRRARRLLVQYDPLHAARVWSLSEIDRLTTICDVIMDNCMMPEPIYLCALGDAVLEFERAFSCGADAYLTVTAWDVLAQAEAGLGQAVEPAHYEGAHARHSRAAMKEGNNIARFPSDRRREERAAAMAHTTSDDNEPVAEIAVLSGA